MAFSMFIPILIVVLSNVFYHICTKSVPQGLNTFASLTVTYAVGAIASLIMYFVTCKEPNIIGEYRNLNWTSFVLGLAIIGLEAGFMQAYKAGWTVSTAQIVASALLAAVLIVVGYFVYHEAISMQKIIGIAVCLVGLYLINK